MGGELAEVGQYRLLGWMPLTDVKAGIFATLLQFNDWRASAFDDRLDQQVGDQQRYLAEMPVALHKRIEPGKPRLPVNDRAQR